MRKFGRGTPDGPDENGRCPVLPLPQGDRRGSIKRGTVQGRPMKVMGGRQPVAVVIRIIHGRIDRRVTSSGMKRLYAMQQDARLHTKAFVLVPVRAIATRRLNHGSPFPGLSGGVTPQWKIRVKTGFGADVSGIVQEKKQQERCHDKCAVIQAIARPRGWWGWKYF
jgi:hypothetical protein